MASATSSRKPVVVCMHGYVQTAELFRAKIGSLRKGLKSRSSDMVCVDAPYLAFDDGDEERAAKFGGRTGGRSWWRWDEAGDPSGASRPSLVVKYEDLEPALECIAAIVERRVRADPDPGPTTSPDPTSAASTSAPVASSGGKCSTTGSDSGVAASGSDGAGAGAGAGAGGEDELHPAQPVDGIIAFSQGAVAAAMYLSYKQREGLPLPKFAILVGGFYPRDEAWMQLLRDHPPQVPVLFVSGTGDDLVPPSRTLRLAEPFPEEYCRVFMHPGAHFVPTCSGEFKRQVTKFVDDALSAEPFVGGGLGPLRDAVTSAEAATET